MYIKKNYRNTEYKVDQSRINNDAYQKALADEREQIEREMKTCLKCKQQGSGYKIDHIVHRMEID